jgi:hypothetical protein
VGLTRFVGRVDGASDGPNGLPNYEIPDYAGIGANEFIVDITHEVPGPDGKPVRSTDFISTMNTDRKAEWNMWYHTLNCGFRVRASGETDFPCVTGERVGVGRVYVKVDPPLTYDRWCEALGDGRSYVSDGTCHLMDFRLEADGRRVAVGEQGSELRLDEAGKVRVTVAAAARRQAPKELPLEVVVNGLPAAAQTPPSRWVDSRAELRGADRTEWLGRSPNLPVRAHQSSLRHRGREADPGVAPQRGMVPPGGGPVLEREEADVCSLGDGRSGPGLRARAAGVSEDPGGVGRAGRLILDDRDAREGARARHLPTAGTLAVLEEAARRDLIDMDQAIQRLRGTNDRATEELRQSSLERVRQRRRGEDQARTTEPAKAAPRPKASPKRGTTRTNKPGGH